MALKSVPAIDKQELLLYIAGHFPDSALKIATDSGHIHEGVIITIGRVRNDDAFLVLQVTGERNEVANRFVHLSLYKIASIELIDPEDVVNILSLGRITKGEQ